MACRVAAAREGLLLLGWPLNYKNLEQRLFEELNQLRKLEPGVELALRSL